MPPSEFLHHWSSELLSLARSSYLLESSSTSPHLQIWPQFLPHGIFKDSESLVIALMKFYSKPFGAQSTGADFLTLKGELLVSLPAVLFQEICDENYL